MVLPAFMKFMRRECMQVRQVGVSGTVTFDEEL
jgi:hypothetical protein